MTPPESKATWRKAKFHCQCEPSDRRYQDSGKRIFCKECAFLIFPDNTISNNNKCCSCLSNDFWHDCSFPCLACQMKTIVYRDPFRNRFHRQLEYWLYNEDTDDTSISFSKTPVCPQTPNSSTQDMLHRRNLTIERSFREAKSRGSVEQTRFVFENLSMLQNDIQSQCSTHLKRDFDSQEDTSLASRIADENLSPAKKVSF